MEATQKLAASLQLNSVKVKVILQTTVTLSSCQAPISASLLDFIIVRQLRGFHVGRPL
jgi:hypothetical protein